jgi:hypothetical protein
LAGLESFYQHELVRVVNAAGPLEEQVARLIAGRLGEFVGEREPLMAAVGVDRELDNDEDHGCIPSGFGACRRGRVTRDENLSTGQSAIGEHGLTNATQGSPNRANVDRRKQVITAI